MIFEANYGKLCLQKPKLMKKLIFTAISFIFAHFSFAQHKEIVKTDKAPIPIVPASTSPVFDLALTKKKIGSGPYSAGSLVSYEIVVLNKAMYQPSMWR